MSTTPEKLVASHASYFSLDLRALALFRIGLGTALIWDLLLRLRDLETFCGDNGVLPRKLFLELPVLNHSIQLFMATGSAWGLSVLFFLALAASVCLVVGYQTRIASLACWFWVVFLQLRNPLVLDGGDELLRLLLFWAPFLPLAARWSVEAKSDSRWNKAPDSYRSVATIALHLQYFLFYFFAAFLKNGPDWLQTREALYYVLSIDQFTTRFGKFLLGYPDLLKWGTVAGLVSEYALALLLLAPLRFAMARTLFFGLLLLFHLSLAAMLNLGIFQFIVILGSLAFVPTSWFVRVSGGEPVMNFHDYPRPYRLSRLETGFAWLMVSYIVLVNIQSVTKVEKLNRWTYAVAIVTYEHQHWHLFAPEPFRNDGWFVFEVTDEKGRVWNEWGRGETGDKPDIVSAQFPNHRWRRWLQNLAQNEFSGIQAIRDSTVDYLLTGWAERHPGQRARSARLLYFEEYSVPPGQSPIPQLRVLSSRSVP